MHRPWTKKEIEYLKANYGDLPTKEIGRAINRTKNAVIARAGILGIVRKPVNHSFFSEWSNDMAYVLGFWAADGCVSMASNKPLIMYSQSEKGILRKIKKLICPKHKINELKDGCNLLSYISERQEKDLTLIFGMDVHNKSTTLKFPNVPDLYARDFVRGVIDGDGCLTWTGTKKTPRILLATGSERFANDFLKFVSEHTSIVGSLYHYKNRNLINVYYTGIKALCFSSWMYDDASMYLDRKMQRHIMFTQWKPSGIRKSSLTPQMCSMFPQFIPERYRKD